MTTLSDSIPNTHALEQVVDNHLPALITRAVAKVGHLEQEYKRIRLHRKYAGTCATSAFLLLASSGFLSELAIGMSSSLGEFIAQAIQLLIFPIFFLLIYLAWRLFRDPNNVVGRFGLELNDFLFPQIAQMLGAQGQMVASTYAAAAIKPNPNRDFFMHQLGIKDGASRITMPEREQVIALLDHSELITEPRNRVGIDDMMHMTCTGRTLFMSELSVKHVSGSGKNKRTKDIFKGYFVTVDLERDLEGKTFVSSEGDKKGFGHKSFWGDIKGTGAQETILEWNDFEALLHVAATDPVEARYILTTDFMEELHDWWQENKGNIRLSFVANRMYVLFPDKGIKFYDTVPSLEKSALRSYVLSIATPLLHVLHLIEKVKL